jgi:type I restriction enzyme S subunit
MAQAIFKSWFVDFEPWSGEMPDDWETQPFSNLVTMSTQSINPQHNQEVVFEHYSIPAFDETRFPVFELGKDIKSNKYIVDKGSFVVSKLNPSTKRVWRPYCMTENPVCSTEFMVYRAKQPNNKEFCYAVVDSDAFTDWLLAHITGSTGSRQRTIPSKTLDFLITVPPDKVIQDFCTNVAPMYQQIEKNQLENRTLQQTRDTLLPRLMSGELTIEAVL